MKNNYVCLYKSLQKNTRTFKPTDEGKDKVKCYERTKSADSLCPHRTGLL